MKFNLIIFLLMIVTPIFASDLAPAYQNITIVYEHSTQTPAGDPPAALSIESAKFLDVTQEGVYNAIGIVPKQFSQAFSIPLNSAVSGDFVYVRPAPYGVTCPSGVECLEIKAIVNKTTCLLHLQYQKSTSATFYKPQLFPADGCGSVTQATDNNKSDIVWDIVAK